MNLITFAVEGFFSDYWQCSGPLALDGTPGVLSEPWSKFWRCPGSYGDSGSEILLEIHLLGHPMKFPYFLSHGALRARTGCGEEVPLVLNPLKLPRKIPLPFSPTPHLWLSLRGRGYGSISKFYLLFCFFLFLV